MKFFVNSNQILDNQVKIIGTDVNHIKNVLRKKKDDIINVVCKETNKNYITKILEISPENIILEIVKKDETVENQELNVHIFQGLPKADKMELIIQKCTEIGVNQITPVSFKRCVVKLDKKDEEKKILRWQKIAEVASKQSERNSILTINRVKNIEEMCKIFEQYDKVFIAYEKEEKNFIKDELKKLDSNYKNIALIIGPEGGIEENELERICASGAISVSLGKRILRTETAPIVLSAIIMYELENMGGK